MSIIRLLDSLTANNNMTLAEAIETMSAKRGIWFDPDIFDIFVKIKNQLRLG